MICEDITILYNSKCGICGGYENASTTNIFTEQEINDLISGVQTGLYTTDNLPRWFYNKTAEALFIGAETGYGSTLLELEFGSTDYLLLKELQTNIYVFSGAKTYQQVNEIQELLVKYKDRPDLFRKEALKSFEDYNTPRGANYLSAEYQTAKTSARAAKNWIGIDERKDVLPYLEYQTVGDARVRPEHASLDGITRLVTDKFWSLYYPPNGWRCRCTTLSHDEATVTDMRGFKQPENVPDVFLMNAGKDRIVFSEKHPYFKVKKGDKESALNNFGLPLP